MKCQKANQQFNWNGDFIFEPMEQVKDRPDVLKKAYVSTLNGREGVIRKFTPRECLRLMGYPDSFKIVMPDTEMYRQCGNSIVVNVLEEIVKELYNCGALK
jgi:DNA (cytosine-5)-methyltransferase 1